jgi:hypothetical protein
LELGKFEALLRDYRPKLREPESSRLLVRLLGLTRAVVCIADIGTAFDLDGDSQMGTITHLLPHADIGVMRQINEDDPPC